MEKLTTREEVMDVIRGMNIVEKDRLLRVVLTERDEAIARGDACREVAIHWRKRAQWGGQPEEEIDSEAARIMEGKK